MRCLQHNPREYSRISSIGSIKILAVWESNAQPTSASISLTPESVDSSSGICQLILPSSDGWSAIEVVLRDLYNDQVIMTHEFEFDQTQGLPAGLSWVRNGNEVSLGLGSFPRKLAWKGKIRLKSTSNQWSEPFEFLFN